MKLTSTLTFVLTILCFSVFTVKAQINWDFEDGEDHEFVLQCINPATPADDDPAMAGDEAITGVGGAAGLPDAGVAWTIGEPDIYDGLEPAVNEGTHVAEGVLEYNDSNDPFGAVVGEPPYDFTNGRGQSGYLNTYCLNQWGDNLHSAENDQIATSPAIMLNAGAGLTVWAIGFTSAEWAGTRTAPKVEGEGYATGSGGIAILSAEDNSLLDTLKIDAESANDGNVPDEFTLDLSALAGQAVIIEVVDAIAGGWGWVAIDEIEITNAELYSATGIDSKQSTTPMHVLMQNYPNPFYRSTTIEYTLTKSTQTEIVVYDLIGHEVATLVDEYQIAGTHKVIWDASNVNAGVYFYSMKIDNSVVSTKKMLVK